MIGMAPSHHLFRIASQQWAQGRPLEFAIAIGNPAAVMLASNAYVGYGEDELAIAGGLLGQPLKIARGKTVQIHVPALAEVVVEAAFNPNDLHDEGLVSEFHGLYEDYGPSPLARVRSVTHRRNFVFHTIAASRVPEHMLIGAVMIEATLFRAIRAAVPSVRNVHVTLGGGGRRTASWRCIIRHLERASVRSSRLLRTPTSSSMSLWSMMTSIFFNPADVDWAMATRLRADRDIVVVPRVRADRVDPVKENRTVAKWALIALKEPGEVCGTLRAGSCSTRGLRKSHATMAGVFQQVIEA